MIFIILVFKDGLFFFCRNLVRDNRIVPGGGAAEIAASIAVENAADNVGTIQQYALRGFADALMIIPEALADNSGLNAIDCVTDAKARQVTEKNPNLGIDCMREGSCDMLDQNIWESILSKENQFALATQVRSESDLDSVKLNICPQVVRMILKIDDIISPVEME